MGKIINLGKPQIRRSRVPQIKISGDYLRATKGSAAIDIMATETIMISPGEARTINTNVHLEMPENFCALVIQRSSMGVKHNLLLVNPPALIDSDYRGNIMARYRNLGDTDYWVNAGDRIAQILFIQIPKYDLVDVDKSELSETERGTGGFGSTGK